MSKTKRTYACNECGALFNQWSGQCGQCGAWNSLVETLATPQTKPSGGYSGTQTQIHNLADITVQNIKRFTTGLSELDRVLGGGLVPGSVTLIGGDPGVGKSTMLLQSIATMSDHLKALYVSGEESMEQISMRAKRLSVADKALRLLTETEVEQILHHAARETPQVMVIDSIQTIHSHAMQSAPGSVGQVRESTAKLVRYAKQNNCAIFLVGHVTKDGALAGPRVLEHMVDSVLYFEGEKYSRFRVIRAVKNRFGAVNELGVFAMLEKGLKEVANPSALFLSQYNNSVSGSVVMATWEGSRPLLVEIQALVDDSHLANPRRVAVGTDPNRLAMLLAVLNRHGGITSHDQDVFINVVGGVRVMETSADLSLICAIISSLKNQALDKDLIIFGEIGLAGEIRPVPNGQERLKEAAKHGFQRAIIPKANAPSQTLSGMQVQAVENLEQALDALFQ